MARKTVSLADLTKRVNHVLSATADDMTSDRIAVSVLLESVLMDAGNYHGFQFTDGEHGRLDDTRRAYYMPR